MFMIPSIYYGSEKEDIYLRKRKNELDFPESGCLIRHYLKLHVLSIKELAVLIDINEKYLPIWSAATNK